jgi:cytochrome c peroxidase
MRSLPPFLLLFAACSSAPTSDDPVELGALLFHDPSLSSPPGVACASCHDAAQAFTGSNASPVDAVALGSRPGQLGTRNVPTILYASFSPRFGVVDGTPTGGQFWDGRADDLVEQAKGPLLNPAEMNNADAAAVVAAVRAGDAADAFRAVYGDDAFDDPDRAFDRIAQAIAAFEESDAFHPFSSKFDAVLRGAAQLDEREARGFALFTDPEKGNCIACHAGAEGSRDPADWLFTDFTYDTLGAPRNPDIPANADPSYFDLGLCANDVCGAFKVPTLRDIARTAPYGHNGRFATLKDIVTFYVTRDTDPARWYPDGTFDDLPPDDVAQVNTTEVPYDRHPGEAPRLSDAEIDDVVAFLGTLTDGPGEVDR